MPSKPEFFQAREAFITTKKGLEIGFVVGQIVAAGNPILKTHGALFEPVAEDAGVRVSPEPDEKPVEQATAAPGEKRTTGKAITTASFKGKEQ